MESRFHGAGDVSVGRCRGGEKGSEGNVSFKIILSKLLVMR